MLKLPKINFQFASASLEEKVLALLALKKIRRWILTALSKVQGELTIRFINQAESKALNYYFRQRDKSTNVLTFIYSEVKSKTTRALPLHADIVICWPVVLAEARAQNKSLEAHLAHLVLHGCLHARGFDHEKPQAAQKMEALEVRILKMLGYPNPY
ncbi:MAG: rRNA maturation RNase YbeY [Burkholderiaceae bacterium]|nr:rRNA maturation RNase YbeY [Burkholderiaceae bacterium]